jgi:hypothetical protein
MRALLDDIQLALKVGSLEIICLRREVNQLIELLEDQIECDVLKCRHGYYLSVEHHTIERDEDGKLVTGDTYEEVIYPHDFPCKPPGCEDGEDGEYGYYDPDDPDYQA